MSSEKEDNFFEELEKHIEDIKEIEKKGRQKREKVKNMIQERKKEENGTYTFQQQVNKKHNDKIKKDFHEKQEECSELFNPMEFWENIEQNKEDIEKSAEKGRKKREKVENMIQEKRKEENVAYDFQLQDNKKYHDKDFNEGRQEECSEFFNPIEAWSNGYFPTQYEKEDIKEIAGKGKEKLNKVKNMIQERKKEENVTYDFQLQVNKKDHNKIKKDFNERQEESLEFNNPIEDRHNICFLIKQHKKDIEKSAEKCKEKLNKVENMIQERKKEENIKDYTLKPHLSKPFRRIRLKSSNNKDSYLQIYQNKVFNKKNKLQKKDKPIIKKHTSPTNAVNYYHKHTNDTFNNETSYVDKYFDFNKNNSNEKKDNDVFSRLYQDTDDRKVRLNKLLDTIYRKNANIYNKTQNKNLGNFNQNPYKRK